MLSFSGKIHMRKTMQNLKTIIKIITKSLQVPCSPLFYTSKSYLPGKRVLPFISHKKIGELLDGSIAVEAALVLPLFLFFGLAILAPIKWMDTQRKVQTVVEKFGETLSQSVDSGESFSDTAAGLWLYGQISSDVDSVLILKSDVFDDQGNVQLELMYQERIPFFFKYINGVIMRVAVKRRCWTGFDGKLKEQNANGESGVEMVYVTPMGERYHRYRDCHHLTNICKAVSKEELDYLRNNDGKIYYLCSQCIYDQNIQDTVYITSWGTRFHNERSCAAMSTYFHKVPLTEVIGLGECSVCARRRNESLVS